MQANVLSKEPICALSTAPGESAIAVVRLSGGGCHEIARRHFRALGAPPAPAGRLDLPQVRSATAGYFHHADEILDEVVLVLYEEPASYTGEDMVEISCHGSMQVVDDILDALLASGVRMAEPGEFTRRAFLNGKLDLTQAEAVCDLIEARSALARRAALESVRGALGREVRETASSLLDLLADVEASIDFVEEDLEFFSRVDFDARVAAALSRTRALRSTARLGRRLRTGIRVTLVGAPNVGKSSLYNRILGEDRAIVTPIPGTTRDRLRESITLGGFPLVLEDTAGMRSDPEPIEGLGVEGARRSMMESDLLLFVLDGSRPLEDEDFHTWRHIDRVKTIVLLNKSDLESAVDRSAAASSLGIGIDRIHAVSARAGSGLEGLNQKLLDLLGTEASSAAAEARVAVNARQGALLGQAEAGLEHLARSLEAASPPEILALDLRVALEALEEITGERVSDDVLGRIFERFCVGK